MTWRLAVLAAAVLAGLNACGGGGRGGPDLREAAELAQGIAGGGPGARPGPNANEAYVQGLELRKKGDCKAAVEKVRFVANLGPGYEGAQFALGDCLTRLAAGPDAPEFHEGLMWLLRGADGGWTEAQGRLADLYVLGPASARNVDEGAYWFALYSAGAALPRFGFEPMPPETVRAIGADLTAEQRAAGNQRAAAWQKKPWIPPATARPPDGAPPAGAPARAMRRGPR
jgi:hypothetical protein